MAQGLSLHIGLNSVDPDHYQGWSGELAACEFDAKDMAAIAKAQGFKPSMLLTKAATRNTVLTALDAAAKSLGKGDMYFLTYSGHGGQLPDLNGEEVDAADETWCLYDGEMIDDEIFAQLAKFKAGVRILVLSDSCHSGTVLKMTLLNKSAGARYNGNGAGNGMVYRAMPDAVAQRVYLANQNFYDPILKDKKLAKAQGKVTASAKLISGCQDNQLSSDGTFNGLFTAMLKSVWNGGKFKGNYAKFHSAIVKKMPNDQTPNLFKVGGNNATFDGQRPFQL